MYRAKNRVVRLLGRLSAVLALASILLIVGGITWQPPLPKCSHCAVLAHRWPGCPLEAVVGGYVCG